MESVKIATSMTVHMQHSLICNPLMMLKDCQSWSLSSWSEKQNCTACHATTLRCKWNLSTENGYKIQHEQQKYFKLCTNSSVSNTNRSQKRWNQMGA